MENVFSREEMEITRRAIREVVREDSPQKILEKNGLLRSFFAPHKIHPVFDSIGRLGKLVEPSRQLLESDIYIHQTKINFKSPLEGDRWEWHQDFPYWHIEDGMPAPRVLTAMIFIDEVNEFNGPMLLVPGSHRAGLVDDLPNDDKCENESEWFQSYQKSTSYMSNLTAKLKYTLKSGTLEKWVGKNGMYSAKGSSGSVLLFNGLVFHASSANLSPWSRDTYLITYNSVHNKLKPVSNPRPDFLANYDYTPIQVVNDLLSAAGVS